eukprot:Colp12_sorted_trinity150504_noHs@23185
MKDIKKIADPICSNCNSVSTPMWRRGPDNTLLCNACGLFWKTHNEQRPVFLNGHAPKKPKKSPRSSGAKEPTKIRRRKSDAFKAPENQVNFSYTFPGTAMLYFGVLYKVGDCVAIRGQDGMVYYSVLRGFYENEFGKKSCWIQWLVPKDSSRRNTDLDKFDVNAFALGPDEKTLVPMEQISRPLTGGLPQFQLSLKPVPPIAPLGAPKPAPVVTPSPPPLVAATLLATCHMEQQTANEISSAAALLCGISSYMRSQLSNQTVA